MKAAVDAHFGRQELQKQLVNVTNLASWKEFCTKFGDVLAETLDGIINACKVAKAKTKKGLPGWYRSSEKGETTAPHAIVEEFVKSLTKRPAPLAGLVPPSEPGKEVAIGLDDARSLDGKVRNTPVVNCLFDLNSAWFCRGFMI